MTPLSSSHGPGRKPRFRWTMPVLARSISAMHAEATEENLFEALIVPHRNLTARGWCWLVLGLLGATGLTVLRFWLLGDWPVAIFAALEIGPFLILFAVHLRGMRHSELLALSPSRLSIVQMGPNGKCTARHLQPGWLNVVLQERTARVSALLFTIRVRRQEIARALGEAEKRDLAWAPQTALYQPRNPRFDNLQLRAPHTTHPA